jgi:hypothetical protein
MPVIRAKHLDDLLASIYAEAEPEEAQRADVRDRVRPHLNLIVTHHQVVPKRIKRFINGYILQTLINPDLDRDVILVLQVIAFRDDWEGVYNAIDNRPDIFRAALESYRAGNRSALQDVLPDLHLIPADLSIYLDSDLVAPLTKVPSLDDYLSCMRSAH